MQSVYCKSEPVCGRSLKFFHPDAGLVGRGSRCSDVPAFVPAPATKSCSEMGAHASERLVGQGVVHWICRIC